MDTYKKKYKEALERARVWKDKSGMPKNKQGILDDIFPELAEPEDEKIRKTLIILLQHFCKGYRVPGLDFPVSYKDMLAWLEKQDKSSDQIHYWTEEEIEPIISDYLRGAEHYGGMIARLRCLKPKSLEKQGKQKPQRMISAEAKEAMYGKPAWSEEDEKKFADACIMLDWYKGNNWWTAQYIKDWLKSLKDRVQPKQEWTKEDEKIFDRICALIHSAAYKNYDVDEDGNECGEYANIKEWFKKLKDRVQPQNITVTDEELVQAKKDAYNDALDKIEYHSGEPTFDDGWSSAIWYLKKRNTQPQNTWKPSDGQMADLWNMLCECRPADHQLLQDIYYGLKRLREE